MKLTLNVHKIDWWIWLMIWATIAIGFAGVPEGFKAAVVVSAINLMYCIAEQRSLTSFPVQVRVVWLAMILAALWPPLWWMFIALFIGDSVYLLFDRCGIARVLILMPWNKNETLH